MRRMPAPDVSTSSPTLSFPVPGWLKVDFHIHTREDPEDFLDHSALELLHRAKALGFHALSITLHSQVLMEPSVADAARELGLLLIPGAEMRLEGCDVLVLNISPEEAAGLRTLDDLADLRKRRGDSVLIIAPHPFFVISGSIGKQRLLKYIDLFDAIEISHFHTSWFNRNRPAIRIAKQFQKPLVATSDAHRLDGFGQHYSLVQTPTDASAEAIFEAIRGDCIRLISPPLSTVKLVRLLWWIFVLHGLKRLRAWFAKRG